jgi:hypothetical protein
METKLTQAIAVVAAPVLTVVSTAIVATHAPGLDKSASDAAGAAFAGLTVFGLTLAVGALPKRSRWWRRHFDPRAAFEGWWMQTHDKQDRASVFSFLYCADTDSFNVDGNAFCSGEDRLAHWRSTHVYFGSDRVGYLWEGDSYEDQKWIHREGTTDMWLTSTGTRGQPQSGGGKVLHLQQERELRFDLQRITPRHLHSLLLTDMRMQDLGDIAVQKRLAQAHLARHRAATSV